MKWIDSAGGPLVVLDRGLIHEWSGYRGDYERACQVWDVDSLPLSAGVARVLVLWGEPLSTSYLEDLGVIVQWRFSESEDELIGIVRDRLPELEWERACSFESDAGAVLFDAATPGDELDPEDQLFIDWPSGHGEVRVAEVTVAESAARVIAFLPTAV